jgi:hypothetical protein
MAFAVGDRVKLKPNQTSEDEVLAFLGYDTVYTVASVGRDSVTLEEDTEGTFWLTSRFELVAPAGAPGRGDIIEVTVRAEVAAIQPVDGEPGITHIVYLTHRRRTATFPRSTSVPTRR